MESVLKPVLAGLVLISAGPALLNIDIHRTCAETANGDNPKICADEERYAKEKLLKYGDSTPLSLKRRCISSAQLPAPSYFALRDRINDNGTVEKHPAR